MESAEKKLYKLHWRNKATGVEGNDDFIRAGDMLDAIDQAKRWLVKNAGMNRADIEILDAEIRDG